MNCFALTALLFLSVANSHAFKCSSNAMTIKYQAVPYYFPAQGTDDSYNGTNNCEWIIQVPEGYYLTLNMSVEIRKKPDELSAGRTCEGTYFSDSYCDAFLCDYVSESMSACERYDIRLHTENSGRFSFAATWSKYPVPQDPVVTTIDEWGYTLSDPESLSENNVQTFAIDSDVTHISLTDGRPWDRYKQMESEAALSTRIYDGPAVVPGDHYTVLKHAGGNYPVTSSLNSLTLFYSVPFTSSAQFGNTSMLLAYDPRLTASFDCFVYQHAAADNTDVFIYAYCAAISISVQGGGPVTFYNMSGLGDEDYGTADVYLGLPRAEQLATPLVTFSPSNRDILPYHFNSSLVTVVMRDYGEVMIATSPEWGPYDTATANARKHEGKRLKQKREH